jgi:hypothetical protein
MIAASAVAAIFGVNFKDRERKGGDLTMALGLQRINLQAIAQTKLDDAELLLFNARYSNAYYLAGFAVEIGLKASIAKLFLADAIPDIALVRATYVHNLKDLLTVAGLKRQHTEAAKQDVEFGANWGLVAQWSPEIRYETVDSWTAQLMLQAIAAPQSGVFPWIKQFW